MAEEKEQQEQKKKKKQKRSHLVPLVLLTFVAVFALGAALVFYMRTRQLTEENAELQRRIEEEYVPRTQIDGMLTEAEQAGMEAGIAQGREEL
ncbi:MAG: hypothetical protein IJQ26_02805, partial [Lachnospiraceae bacterium]|nr:hypothetical protein [Lachnospiraceae bacterium]